MGRLVRLPGSACRHFERGRCLYEEALNPGYNRQWRCAVLVGWEAAYDEFLDRADRFGIRESELAGLLRRRFERLTGAEVDCEHYAPGADASLPECLLLVGELCLLKLPECGGVCRNFSPMPNDPTTDAPMTQD